MILSLYCWTGIKAEWFLTVSGIYRRRAGETAYANASLLSAPVGQAVSPANPYRALHALKTVKHP
jgi:hypothetical protein